MVNVGQEVIIRGVVEESVPWGTVSNVRVRLPDGNRRLVLGDAARRDAEARRRRRGPSAPCWPRPRPPRRDRADVRRHRPAGRAAPRGLRLPEAAADPRGGEGRARRRCRRPTSPWRSGLQPRDAANKMPSSGA